MPITKAPTPITTKTGVSVETNYCRKCMKILPAKEFYECVDQGFVDANGLMSVCKNCTRKMYDELIAQNGSMEKTLHKMCTSLNVRFSNEAASATKANINTLLEGGKKVDSVFGIYKQKLIATKKSMDKSGLDDMTYEDVGTIFTTETPNIKEIPIPQDVAEFWGKDLARDDIEFLETNYTNFKQTHKADTYAEIVLLKQVCYTMLDIKKARANSDDTEKLLKELQSLMNNLAISPKTVNSSKAASRETESFGLWIQDIEQNEPAEWLKTDPRGDIYRDVGNVEEYFQKYVVRPLKNFIMGSKDFNIDNEDNLMDDIDDGEESTSSFSDIDEGD